MKKLKFNFKIKELELQIEGSHDEVNTITANLGDQIKNLMRPGGTAVNNSQRLNTNIIEEAEAIAEYRTRQKEKRQGMHLRENRKKLQQ